MENGNAEIITEQELWQFESCSHVGATVRYNRNWLPQKGNLILLIVGTTQNDNFRYCFRLPDNFDQKNLQIDMPNLIEMIQNNSQFEGEIVETAHKIVCRCAGDVSGVTEDF